MRNSTTRLLALFCLLISATSLFGQTKKVQKLFKESKYSKVYSYHKSASSSNDIQLIRPVAYSAYYLKNYKKAIDLYNRLISLNTSEANVYDLFYLAQSYRSLENYPIADSITREINYKFPTVVVYPETSNWFKDDINYESEFFQSLKNLYGLDSAIVSPFESNSKYGEYGLISNNGKQYFTTNNPDFLGELTANNYRNERDFAIIERDGDSYTPILNVSGESCQLNYIDPTGEWFSITVTDTKPNDENKKILKSYLLKRKKALDGWDTMSLVSG